MTLRLPPPILALSCAEVFELAPSALVGRVEAAVDSGLGGVLLRERAWSERLLLQTAKKLRTVLGDGWLGISDAPHLVRACEADGVHLSHRALDASEVRELVGPEVAVGISDHLSHPRRDCSSGDYAFLSPVGDVSGKEPALGVRPVVAWAQRHPLATWALGGIGPGDPQALRAGGLHGCAYLRGILGAEDPGTAFAQWARDWEQGE